MENNRTASLCFLVQSMLQPERGFKWDKKLEEVSRISMHKLCLTLG